jgi:hypothetical protein
MISVIFNVIMLIAFSAYKAPDSDLIFSHQSHFVERDIECAACHNTAKSVSALDENMPGHDECSECHSVSNAPDDCRLCHRDPENPLGIKMPWPELIFAHVTHVGSDPTSEKCLSCHKGIANQAAPRAVEEIYPSMNNCFQCHDGLTASAECKACHSQPTQMADLIHPADWEHAHRFVARDEAGQSCTPCHHTETFCSECHVGDNLVETVHDLNYRFNHGLDARGKEFECQNCHDFESFCSSCHEQQDAMPFNHTFAQWHPRINPRPHAEAARRDIESCAACHSGEESRTCSQPGCHGDYDGIRGTQQNIHPSDITDMGEGPWHDDSDFECFQCHTNTQRAGVGFCGYCHN